MAKVVILGSIAKSLILFRGALLKELRDRGHEVIAFAPSASKEVIQDLTNLGVSYHNIEIDRIGLCPLKDIRSISQLIASFRKINPDIVLAYTVKPVTYGSLAARIAGVSNIYSIISGIGSTFSDTGIRASIVRFIVKRLYRLALSFNQKIFFQNPDDLNLFREKSLLTGGDNAVIINGSGVDISLFSPVSFPKTLSFLLIARLIKDKGVYEYVEAARRVKQRFPNVNFRLAGYIDKKPSAISQQELQSWIESDVIEYLGFLNNVRPAISDSSVYVLPSYREGTPHSVLQAMAMERPIITTDVPGCRETVKQGDNGLLVTVRDVSSLEDAMMHFINFPHDVIRMGANSRRIAVDKYDVHKVNAVILSNMELA